MAASVEDLKLVLRHFSAVLKNCRRAAGRSQIDLAGDAGLHRTYISALETARKEPGLQTLIKLGRGLSMSAGVLVESTELALFPPSSKEPIARDFEARIPLGTETCPECRARYLLFAQRLRKRERGKFKCRRCKTQLASWLATTKLVYETPPPVPKGQRAR